jgi:Tol biopolymer transport system component
VELESAYQTSGLNNTVAWSPDGSQVAFIANRDARDAGEVQTFSTVHVVPAAGGTARDLGPEPLFRKMCVPQTQTKKRCFSMPTGNPLSVVWLPGGGGVVYASEVMGDVDVTSKDRSSKNVTRIFRLRPEEEPAKPELLREVSGALDQLVAAPDGRHLLYGQRNGESHVLDLAGKPSTYRTHRLGRRVESPTWSPDGKRLVFVQDLLVKTAKADGTGVRTVDHMPWLSGNGDSPPSSKALQAVWSPDGKQIAFSGRHSESASVVLMNADGSGQHKLYTVQRGHIELVRWLPVVPSAHP